MTQPQPPGIKKMKQGMSYTCKEKTIILNVFKYFKQEFPDICVTEVVRRTAKATGCSEKSVFQFRKEEASAEGFKEPSKTKIRKNININSRDIKYDSSVRQAIREIIYDLKYRNVVPSLSTIRKQVNSNECLPNFSLMTLRRLLFDMGFCYEKNGNKSILVEKQGIENKNSGNTVKNGNLKKPNCDNKIVTGKSNNRNNLINTNDVIPTSAQNISNNVVDNSKPQIIQMQVIQGNVNHSTNPIQNGLNPNGNEQEYRRVPVYVRHPENMNNVPSMYTVHHNMPIALNHRNDVVPHHTNTIQMRSPNLNVPVKCEMIPWMNPPPPHIVNKLKM